MTTGLINSKPFTNLIYECNEAIVTINLSNLQLGKKKRVQLIAAFIYSGNTIPKCMGSAP